MLGKTIALVGLLLSQSLSLFSASEVPLPFSLQGVPFADKQGIVLNVKNVSIQNVESPHNAAITKGSKGEYLLIFRYDTRVKKERKHNYIAVVGLDKKLEPMGSFKKIDTLSDFSNDPRIFHVGPQSFLVYNDTVAINSQNRIMKIAELDMSNFQLKNITPLDRKIQKLEKNWTPFSYKEDAREEVYFIYTFDPFDVLKLGSLEGDPLKKLGSHSPIKKIPWYWGSPRGGTQAECVDGQYLTFFHSSFTDRDGKRWYVMGALTFEARPPFRVTAISPYPILFNGIYGTRRTKNVSSRLRCIFPSGFVLTEDKSQILVSCGENDAAVKIITFDKEALLNSLVKIP